MEYKTPSDPMDLNSSSIIFGNSLFEAYDFENNNDFNYSPFRITNTMGMQRLEFPVNE